MLYIRSKIRTLSVVKEVVVYIKQNHISGYSYECRYCKLTAVLWIISWRCNIYSDLAVLNVMDPLFIHSAACLTTGP
jgi:hypothetical protein